MSAPLEYLLMFFMLVGRLPLLGVARDETQ